MKRPPFNRAQAAAIWRPLYWGRYSVSNTGKVRSKKIGNMRLLTNTSGYLYVRLWVNKNTQKYKSVHRLVAAAFIGRSKLGINHRDGNKKNNHVKNLEYASCADNMEHAKKNGLVARGSRHGHSRLTARQVIKIRTLLGKMTQRKIAKLYAVTPSTISEIKRGEIWAWLK